MTIEEAVKAYIDKFGYFPIDVFSNCNNDKIIEIVEKCLLENNPAFIERKNNCIYY